MAARVRWDTTINVGTVLSLITTLLALWGASSRLEHRLTALETKTDLLWQVLGDKVRTVTAAIPP